MSFNGKYEIVRVINQGGAFGTLFEVKDKSNVHYALKLIKNNLSDEYKKETFNSNISCVVLANSKNILQPFILKAEYNNKIYTKEISIIPLW